MNVLITGGAGYIGTELVTRLNARTDISKIVVYDSLSRGNHNLFIGGNRLNRKKIRFVQGELLDTRRLKKEVEEADVVFHMAAKVTTPFADHDPHNFDQVNNWGTSELTYLVENAKVSRYIYLSSASVYGASVEESDVETPINPRTFYGISKARGEEHVKRLVPTDTETFIFRCGNVYGFSKCMRLDSVINKFLFEAHHFNRVKIFGDGNQTRSFIHIDRLSSLLNQAVYANLQPGAYNVVENTFSVHDIVEVLRSLYPTLEMTYVNQNMPMRNLKVRPDDRLPQLKCPPGQLEEDLRLFRDQFSF